MTASRAPERVSWAVEQLAPAASDHILEIGCGPGHAVALVCPRLLRGTITAIDRSALQIEKAHSLNRQFVKQGRARIETMTLADAPAALDQRFAKVLAVNVNAFWTEPAPSIASLGTLLRAGGRAFLVYEAPSAAGARKLRSALPHALSVHGFDVDEVRVASSLRQALTCIVTRRRRGL